MKMLLAIEILAIVSISAVPINRYDVAQKTMKCQCGHFKTPNFRIKKESQEYGNYFEGDMILSEPQKEEIQGSDGRNGVISVTKRWPNNTVTYFIEEDDFDDEEIEKIQRGMADISKKSCIKFKPKEKDEEIYTLTIQGSSNGCFSSVGYNGADDETKGQILNLGPRCFRHGTIVHEMLHSLGFYHMQSTYDRDEFIEIVWDNIKDGRAFNFKKYTNNSITDFGIPYDYESVMHYSKLAFSKNKEATIIPLKEGVKIGQRKGLSEGDIKKLNRMYCDKE